MNTWGSYDEIKTDTTYQYSSRLMPGPPPSDLSAAAIWFRRRRIYEASQLYRPGSVREPRRPYLQPGAWEAGAAHFHKDLDSLDLTLPSVFTKHQSYVVGSLLFMWDTQGPEARFTYGDIKRAIYSLIKVDGDGLDKISRKTITLVLYMLHESGAVKYVPGFPGMKSTITLVDLARLHDLFPLLKPHQVTYPQLVPSYPTQLLAPPSLVTQEGGQCRHGYWSLLGAVYRALESRAMDPKTRGQARSRVTRAFNKQLTRYGIKGYRLWEYLPKLNFPTQTWYVDSTDENDWQLQAAVSATVSLLMP